MNSISETLKQNVDFIRYNKEEVHARMNEETSRMPEMCLNLVDI